MVIVSRFVSFVNAVTLTEVKESRRSPQVLVVDQAFERLFCLAYQCQRASYDATLLPFKEAHHATILLEAISPPPRRCYFFSSSLLLSLLA